MTVVGMTPPIWSQFRLGLSEQIKNSLLQYPVPDSLDKLMELSVRIDMRFKER